MTDVREERVHQLRFRPHARVLSGEVLQARAETPHDTPIPQNLEDAVAFYRAVGFEFQGEPANADANLPLRQMFGLPDAKLRYQIGRAPGIPGGVEIIEISGAGGQRQTI